MNKSNIIEMDNEINGGHVRFFIYRTPKNNHHTIIRLNKQFIYIRKQGPLYTRFFCLNNKEGLMPFISIAKTVFANQDYDDVWMEIHFYKERKHVYEVQTKIENDENMKPICGQFDDLMTPHSKGIIGDFSQFKV